MNYIRMKKDNNKFDSVNHYATHIEAFAALSNKKSDEERERQRMLL